MFEQLGGGGKNIFLMWKLVSELFYNLNTYLV